MDDVTPLSSRGIGKSSLRNTTFKTIMKNEIYNLFYYIVVVLLKQRILHRLFSHFLPFFCIEKNPNTSIIERQNAGTKMLKQCVSCFNKH